MAFREPKWGKQCLAPLGADARDVLQLAVDAGLPSQRPVMGDAEAVRLIANALHQMQLRRMVIQADGFLPVGKINLLLLFSPGQTWVPLRQGLQGFPGKAQLLGATVNEYQIRQVRKLSSNGREPRGFPFLFFLQAVGETPARHSFMDAKSLAPTTVLIRKCRYSFLAATPSMNTTMDATDSTPWVLEMS